MRPAVAGPVIMVCLLLAAASAAADPVVECHAEGATLSNAAMRCEFSSADGRWRMARLSRADGSAALALDADPIGIVIYEGAELTAADFARQGAPEPGAEPGSLVVTLACADPPVTAELRYWLTGDAPYLRKAISFPGKQDVVIDELRVLTARTDLPLAGGGKGLPVSVGDAWWFGVEYPAFFAVLSDGGFALKHYPGRAPDGEWSSRTMVCGVSPAGLSLDLAFDDYVTSIKRPSRSFLQYNSWYDVRDTEMTLEHFDKTATAYEENMLEPYGLHMDSYQPDDGWQNKQSVWGVREDIYPDGFAPLAAVIEGHGSRMGLWLSLFGVKLDIGWARDNGYEVSSGGGSYCLAGPKSFAATREATRQLIEDGNLLYYKHDFNSLHCSAEGHGHLPTDRHGYEANLDAELDLLAFERELQPDILLNVTSNVWLSPWWLQHADTIWMCASDFGFDRTFPQLSRREWAMSYRDAHFHRVYQEQHNPTPLSALMTHGIIKGNRNRLGGPDETLREWADYVAMYYGRGVLLKELYVSPGLLSEEQWRALGSTTRWATDNWRTLEHTRVFGGSPRSGEPYGYAHWDGDRAIIALRNPSYQAMTIRVPVDQTVGFRGPADTSFAAREVYPAHRPLPGDLAAGAENPLTLPPCSVTLLELRPEADWPTAAPASAAMPDGLADLQAPGRVGGDYEGRQTLNVSLPAIAGPLTRLDLYVIVRGASLKEPIAATRINGDAAPVRVAQGEEWVIHSHDLLPHLGRPVEYEAVFAAPGDQPFVDPRRRGWWANRASARTRTLTRRSICRGPLGRAARLGQCSFCQRRNCLAQTALP